MLGISPGGVIVRREGNPVGAAALVVDDDPVALDLISKFLAKGGIEVLKASGPDDAWPILERDCPDVIVCDWRMPGQDGPAFMAKVRSNEALKSTHFILLTAHGDHGVMVNGLESGADDCLLKPFEPRELVARVRIGLRLRALQRERADLERKLAVVGLAAGMGHEINNPLCALLGHVELSLDYLKSRPDPKLEASLQTIGEMGHRIRTIVERLVNLQGASFVDYPGDVQMLDLKS